MKIISGLFPGQVLQRTKRNTASVKVAGTASFRGPVQVRITGAGKPVRGFASKKCGTADGKIWNAAVAGIPAGGPYRVSFSAGKDSVSINDVFVGDVWIMAGQSNMKGVGDLKDALKPHPLVRMFTVHGKWRKAAEPVNNLDNSPYPSHAPRSVIAADKRIQAEMKKLKGTGPGLSFGREMVRLTGVPQGLIPCAKGGTSLDQWDPAGKKLGLDSLYGTMLLRVEELGQPVAGLLWYQGESNAGARHAHHYTRRTINLLKAVRKDLKQPGLPVVTVQLGPVVGLRWSRSGWISVQEQQRLLPGKMENVTMVPAIDLPVEDEIHISADGQNLLGPRMARAACSLTGLKKGIKPPITVEKIKLVKSEFPGFPPDILITCGNVTGKLVSEGFPTGFAMIDRTGKNMQAVCRVFLKGNTVRVRHSFFNGLPKSMRIAYGMELDEYCNIRDEAGMALPAFGPQKLSL